MNPVDADSELLGSSAEIAGRQTARAEGMCLRKKTEQ